MENTVLLNLRSFPLNKMKLSLLKYWYSKIQILGSSGKHMKVIKPLWFSVSLRETHQLITKCLNVSQNFWISIYDTLCMWHKVALQINLFPILVALIHVFDLVMEVLFAERKNNSELGKISLSHWMTLWMKWMTLWFLVCFNWMYSEFLNLFNSNVFFF